MHIYSHDRGNNSNASVNKPVSLYYRVAQKPQMTSFSTRPLIFIFHATTQSISPPLSASSLTFPLPICMFFYSEKLVWMQLPNLLSVSSVILLRWSRLGKPLVNLSFSSFHTWSLSVELKQGLAAIVQVQVIEKKHNIRSVPVQI